MQKVCADRVKARSVLTILPLLASFSASAQGNHWSSGWHDGWGWGHMLFGSVMMLLFWGGLIILIVLAVRWLGSGPHRGAENSTSQKRALDILEERFARGEIDKDEFEERRRLLSK